MAKTYEQIQQQIEKLQSKAKALQAVEAKGVIVRIKEAIQHYGLTAEQLGFDGAKTSTRTPTSTSIISTAATASAPKQLPVPAAKPAPKAATKTIPHGKPQFSDASGKSWGGRGPRPAWLREALQAGRDINEFRIGKRAKAKKMPVPLGAAIAAVIASPASTPAASTPAAPTRAAATPAATAKRAKVSYGDDAGHSWSGMGPKPGWLKAAIESGKALADFVK